MRPATVPCSCPTAASWWLATCAPTWRYRCSIPLRPIRSVTTARGWSGWRPWPASVRWCPATAASGMPASSAGGSPWMPPTWTPSRAGSRLTTRGCRAARTGCGACTRTWCATSAGDGQQQHRGAGRVQADLVLRGHKVLGGRDDLPVAGVAGEARMCSAGDLEPDPVPAAEPVRRADQAHPHGAGQRVFAGEPHDAVAEVPRPAARVHVAQSHEQVGVRVIAHDGKLDGDLADDLDRLVQRIAAEHQDVEPPLDGPVVAAATGHGQDGAARRRRGIGRVVAEADGRDVRRRLPGAERAVCAEVPALPRGAGRRPVGDLAPLPRALAADPDAYRLVRVSGRGRAVAGCHPRAVTAGLPGAGVAVEPGHALHDRGGTPGREVQVGPRSDQQPGGHAPGGERAVLLEGLLDEQV